MEIRNAELFLVEHINKLKKEGIELSGSVIVLQLEPARFMLSTEGKAAEKLDRNLLKKQEPLICDLFDSREDIIVAMRICSRFCKDSINIGKDIPPVLDDMAQIVGPKAKIFKESDPAKILGFLKKNNACLVKAAEADLSYALIAGKTLEQAFATTLILEKSARAYIEGALIGGAKFLDPLTAWVMHKLYNRSYSKMDAKARSQTAKDLPRSIPEDEMDVRKEMVKYGKKLSEENLVQGTWGNISARLDQKYMLVTPSGLSYLRLTPYDIVRVEIDTLDYEGSLKPTSEKAIHAALLSANPDINCVIHSHPVHCSVFAAARMPLPVENKEEAALLGQETGYAEAAIPGTKKLKEAVSGAIGGGRKVCIMGSHGIIACGVSIADAFDNCRAMEKAARDYLDKASMQK